MRFGSLFSARKAHNDHETFRAAKHGGFQLGDHERTDGPPQRGGQSPDDLKIKVDSGWVDELSTHPMSSPVQASKDFGPSARKSEHLLINSRPLNKGGTFLTPAVDVPCWTPGGRGCQDRPLQFLRRDFSGKPGCDNRRMAATVAEGTARKQVSPVNARTQRQSLFKGDSRERPALI
jgi:hypothetical protein